MKPATHEAANGQPISNPSPEHVLPRCSHRTATGRQCRSLAADNRSALCLRHSAHAIARCAHSSVSSELLGPLTEFQSASDVCNFLSRLLILLAQDRISPRRGAVMIYACNQLLRSLRDIDRQVHPPDEQQEIVIDIPSAVANRALAAQESNHQATPS